MKIADLPIEDRPREKAKMFGIDSLSDSELLAIIIGSGYHGVNAHEVAQHLLASFNSLSSLATASYDSIKIKGLDEVKTLRLLASFEISKRLNIKFSFPKKRSELTSTFLQKYFGNMECIKEEVNLLIYSRSGNLICIEKMYEGTSQNVSFSAKEIIREVHFKKGYSFVLVHNHPSGLTNPSKSDIKNTEELKRLCELTDVKFIDHVIVSNSSFYSFLSNFDKEYKNNNEFIDFLSNLN